MANNVDWRHIAIGGAIASVIVSLIYSAQKKKEAEEAQKSIDETRKMANRWIDDMNKIYDENQKYEHDLFERLNKKEES